MQHPSSSSVCAQHILLVPPGHSLESVLSASPEQQQPQSQQQPQQQPQQQYSQKQQEEAVGAVLKGWSAGAEQGLEEDKRARCVFVCFYVKAQCLGQ